MAISLVSYPTTIESGKVFNIFPGFSAVEIELKREDIQIDNISSGVDNKVLITILSTDLTSNLNVNEFIYLYSVGSSYEYNGVFKILDITLNVTDTEITVDADFIELTTSGYINYKQNYYVEYKLVNINNNNILQYPEMLSDDGNSEGIIKLNVSNPIDFIKTDFLETSGVLLKGQNIFQVMYREVYRENDTDLFTLIDETPIILVYSADSYEPEKFINSIEYPKMWAGYETIIAFLHSLNNNENLRVNVTFDELDINKDVLTSDNALFIFNENDYGILQVNFNDNVKAIESQTKYIKFNANTYELADYDIADYDEVDYVAG